MTFMVKGLFLNLAFVLALMLAPATLRGADITLDLPTVFGNIDGSTDGKVDLSGA